MYNTLELNFVPLVNTESTLVTALDLLEEMVNLFYFHLQNARVYLTKERNHQNFYGLKLGEDEIKKERKKVLLKRSNYNYYIFSFIKFRL